MHGSLLKDNLSSEYFNAFSVLLPKAAARRIYVYVESYEDVSFWTSVLNKFKKGNIEFHVSPPTKKGKKEALQKCEEIIELAKKSAEGLIVCVDSDYDYLLQQQTETSRIINNSDYIFQTFTYSIENLLCFSESLHAVCVASTKHDSKIIDLVELLKQYSNITYDLFLWSVYFCLNNDFKSFCVKDFCSFVKILTIPKVDNLSDKFGEALSVLKEKVDQKLEELNQQFPQFKNEVEKLGPELESLGLNRDSTYLFIQGHAIKDNVVLMFLKPLCNVLKATKINEIKNEAEYHAPKEKEYNVNQYRNTLKDVTDVLDLNNLFYDCSLFKLLEAKLTAYMAAIA